MNTIKEVRKINRLSQKQLAELLGVSRSYIEKIERNKVKPGKGFLQKYKEVFPYERIDTLI